ncbi:SAP30-binding protein [Eupeodes corollae]|uniref:SAP30-binding protein n=1 Tax=Eupeodes corollae TaxID=290404 RepID=UPI00248FF793|nr:SAP30-binding protein [Eupeodes corollae]
MSKSALASLTAQYTDSENEDDNQDDGSSDSQNSNSSQVQIPPPKQPTPVPTPEKPKRPNKALRLVSYQDDTIVSDDEETESEDDSEVAIVESKKEEKKPAPVSEESKMDVDAEEASLSKSPQKDNKVDKYAHYGFSLPPEPKGKPTVELVEKIRHLYDKMETSNMDMNRIIQERKDFRNPSIYEKLISFCDINEFGTNYPPEMYDPLQWGHESFYEELAKAQKIEMTKRQKEKKDSDKIEQATAAARKVEEEAKKRKSKWDQPAPVKTAPPALTTTVTGTKGTVISAFGSLPKKANV